jgi:hypothetical protein
MLVGVDEVDWPVLGKTKCKIGEKDARSKGGQKPKPTFIEGAEIDAVGGETRRSLRCRRVSATRGTMQVARPRSEIGHADRSFRSRFVEPLNRHQ